MPENSQDLCCIQALLILVYSQMAVRYELKRFCAYVSNRDELEESELSRACDHILTVQQRFKAVQDAYIRVAGFEFDMIGETTNSLGDLYESWKTLRGGFQQDTAVKDVLYSVFLRSRVKLVNEPYDFEYNDTSQFREQEDQLPDLIAAVLKTPATKMFVGDVEDENMPDFVLFKEGTGLDEMKLLVYNVGVTLYLAANVFYSALNKFEWFIEPWSKAAKPKRSIKLMDRLDTDIYLEAPANLKSLLIESKTPDVDTQFNLQNYLFYVLNVHKLAPEGVHCCKACNTSDGHLMACGYCHNVLYCSAKCKDKHWTAEHSQQCSSSLQPSW